jgi:acetyl/propionyl-CoA carboxylase alpha subunit
LFDVTVDNNRVFKIAVDEKDGLYRLEIDGQNTTVDVTSIKGRSHLSLLIDNRSYEATIDRDGEFYRVVVCGEEFRVLVEDEKVKKLIGTRRPFEDELDMSIHAPMPGIVVSIDVSRGDEVKKGDCLMVLEAMKMRNELKSSRDGVIKDIPVQTGHTVAKGSILLTYE